MQPNLHYSNAYKAGERRMIRGVRRYGRIRLGSVLSSLYTITGEKEYKKMPAVERRSLTAPTAYDTRLRKTEKKREEMGLNPVHM